MLALRPFQISVLIGAMDRVRRVVKALLWSLAAIVGLLVLLIGARFAYLAIDKEDTFVLQNSEFDNFNYLRQIESSKGGARLSHPKHLPVYVHRLKRGSGTIFAYRFYSDEDVLTIDDEAYQKVTIWIPGTLPNSAIDLTLGDESKCLLVFSRGGSAWPKSECSRYGTSGTVKVEPIGRHFKITIHAEVTPTENARAHGDCESDRMDMTFKAKEIAFENLTPWLGIAGRHPYHETYR